MEKTRSRCTYAIRTWLKALVVNSSQMQALLVAVVYSCTKTNSSQEDNQMAKKLPVPCHIYLCKSIVSLCQSPLPSLRDILRRNHKIQNTNPDKHAYTRGETTDRNYSVCERKNKPEESRWKSTPAFRFNYIDLIFHIKASRTNFPINQID